MSFHPPTQADVAARAAVSRATVSYVLSGRRDRKNPVTPETRERVMAAAKRLGYQRNHAARSVRRRRTELVCVVYRPPDNPWVERLTEQLSDASVRRGYGVVMLPVTSADRAGPALRVLSEHVVDGAVVGPEHCLLPSDLRALARGGLALVVFDDQVRPAGFDVVRQQQAEACRAVVGHLIERGHRRIAHVAHTAELDDPAHAVKFSSYKRALADHGIEYDESLVVPGADSRAGAYLAAQQLFDRGNGAGRPTALFSASDRGAINAIWGVRDLGLRVPDDVAVASVGNTGEGEVVRPGVTTAGVPTHDFSSAIQRLYDRIDADGPQPGRQVQLPWELIVRGST